MPDYTPPRFLTRSDWLARAPKAKLPERPVTELRGTVVHHEAANPSLNADPGEIVAAIQADQMSRGYSDIAYNTLVWHDGTVIFGRDAGVRGAHTVSPTGGDWNYTHMGVCILGNGDDPAYVTDIAWQSVIWCYSLAAYVSGGRATGFLTHHETGSATHCAGTEVQRRMDGLRAWLGAGGAEV